MVPNSAERFVPKKEKRFQGFVLFFCFVFCCFTGSGCGITANRLSSNEPKLVQQLFQKLWTDKFALFLSHFFFFGQAAGLWSETPAAHWFIEETLRVLESG